MRNFIAYLSALFSERGMRFNKSILHSFRLWISFCFAEKLREYVWFRPAYVPSAKRWSPGHDVPGGKNGVFAFSKARQNNIASPCARRSARPFSNKGILPRLHVAENVIFSDTAQMCQKKHRESQEADDLCLCEFPSSSFARKMNDGGNWRRLKKIVRTS